MPYRPAWGQGLPDSGAALPSGSGQSASGSPATEQTALKTRVAVLLDGRPDKSLRTWLLDRLARIGEDAEPAPDASNLGTCRESACLAEHVSQGFRFLVLHVSLAGTRRYFIEAFLFDYGAARAQTARNACEECSTENMQSILGELATQLLAGNRGGRSPGTEPATAYTSTDPEKRQQPAPLPSTGTPPSAQGEPSRGWSPHKIALVSLLSTLTLGGVIASGYFIRQTQLPDGERLCALPESLPSPPESASDAEKAAWAAQQANRKSSCSRTLDLAIGSALVTATLGTLTGIAVTWRESGKPRTKPARPTLALGVLR